MDTQPDQSPKHIDRKALYTSLDARLKYLQDFLNVNSSASTRDTQSVPTYLTKGR